MRSINATLPNEMPAVAVEIGQRVHSYQNITPSEEETEDERNVTSADSLISRLKSPIFMRLGAAFMLVFAFTLLIVSRSEPRMLPSGPKGAAMESVNDAAWMAGSTVATTYCKTSCTSQCSSYFSVYGPLCCDWAEGDQYSLMNHRSTVALYISRK